MNILKLFYHELRLALLTAVVFSITVFNLHEPVGHNWFNGFVYLIMLWAVYYFTFIRTPKDVKLDERETTIYIKTGHLSAFIFMSALSIMYFGLSQEFAMAGSKFQTIWGWFILPAYILLHGFTGLILFYIENK